MPDLSDLYKALAVAYKRSKEGDLWEVAYSRVKEVVDMAEALHSQASSLGVRLDGDVADRLRRFSRVVIEGDESSVIREYESLMPYMSSLGYRVSIARIYLVGSRIISSLAVLLAGVSLLASATSVEGAGLAALAAGLALAGTLLSSYIYSLPATMLAVALEAINIALGGAEASIATIAPVGGALVAVALSLALHLIVRRALGLTQTGAGSLGRHS